MYRSYCAFPTNDCLRCPLRQPLILIKEVIYTMRKFTKRLLSSLALGALAASFAVTGGCGKKDDEKYIVVICKSQDEYWDSTKQGAFDAAEELDIKLDFNAPVNEDAEQQVTMIYDAINMKADAIVLAPINDDERTIDAVKKAAASGIPVITIDDDITCDERIACIKTENTFGGAIAGRAVENIMPEGGDIAIVSHTVTSKTAQLRTEGFRSQLEADGGEAYKIIRTEDCGGDIQLSKEITKKLINENDGLTMIYTTNQPSTIGACQAIAEEGAGARVNLVGFDFFNKAGDHESAETYIESGVLDGVIVQNPYNMGYLGVRYAHKYTEGNKVSANIDTGAYLVTKDNMNDADIQLLLYPTKTK